MLQAVPGRRRRKPCGRDALGFVGDLFTFGNWYHGGTPLSGRLVGLEGVGSKQPPLFLRKLRGGQRKTPPNGCPLSISGWTEGPPTGRVDLEVTSNIVQGNKGRERARQFEP